MYNDLRPNFMFLQLPLKKIIHLMLKHNNLTRPSHSKKSNKL